MKCESAPCRSPIACEGFGYCRDLNLPAPDGDGWFRYARHSDVERLKAEGWSVSSDLGLPHSHYAVLMKWMGEGDPE